MLLLKAEEGLEEGEDSSSEDESGDDYHDEEEPDEELEQAKRRLQQKQILKLSSVIEMASPVSPHDEEEGELHLPALTIKSLFIPLDREVLVNLEDGEISHIVVILFSQEVTTHFNQNLP